MYDEAMGWTLAYNVNLTILNGEIDINCNNSFGKM
jgi:hypothetical protein